MKLSDCKNENALDLLADILEPLSNILMDTEIKRLARDKDTTRIQVVQYLLKNHQKSIIQIMARLDGIPVEKYEINFLALPKKILEIMNDKELIDFFRSQGRMMDTDYSGPATENTEAPEAI